jgi:hypothetical protein
MTNLEPTETVPLKLRMRQGCLLCPLLLIIILKFLATAIGQEQEIKGI